MGSPNYSSPVVRSAENGRAYVRLICRMADLAFRLIQNSNYSDEIKQKATDWRETTQELCAIVDAGWAVLPDGP